MTHSRFVTFARVVQVAGGGFLMMFAAANGMPLYSALGAVWLAIGAVG